MQLLSVMYVASQSKKIRDLCRWILLQWHKVMVFLQFHLLFLGRGTEMAKKPKLVPKGYSFFKVLVGDFKQKLRMPPVFVNKFNGNLPLKCILRTYARRSWHVEVERIANHLFFQNGWPLFVEENLLEIGDILVFHYHGDSEFDIKIFGKSGCEKEDNSLDENCEESILHEEVREQQKEEESIKHAGIDRCECFTKKQSEKLAAYFRKKGQQSRLKQRHAVDSCPFNLVHPHFTKAWTETMQYAVPIPVIFVKAYDFYSKEHVVLHDHTNKRWKLNLVKGKDNRVSLGSPWYKFTRFHHLRDGDVCAFEFIRGERRGARRKIQVHIFRKGIRVRTNRILS